MSPAHPALLLSCLSEPSHGALTELQALGWGGLRPQGARPPGPGRLQARRGLRAWDWVLQAAAASSAGELVLCSEGSAECQAHSRCSINTCSGKVGDGVLGAEGRAGEREVTRKLALEDKCHKNFALAPVSRTIHSPPLQTTCPLVAPEATAKWWLCLWQQQEESAGPLSSSPAPRQVTWGHLYALRGSCGPPSWHPRTCVTCLMLQTLRGPCPPCTSPVPAVGMPTSYPFFQAQLCPRARGGHLALSTLGPGRSLSAFLWPWLDGRGYICVSPGHPTQSRDTRSPG